MRIVKGLAIAALSIFIFAWLSYGEYSTIDALIRDYNKATDLQRAQILGEYQYKTISVNGTVANVQQWDIFDERNQIKKTFYKVTTESTKIDPMNYYTVSVFYKDQAEAAHFNKGEAIELEGLLVKIVAEPGSFSIWIYPGDLSDEDKIMFAR